MKMHGVGSSITFRVSKRTTAGYSVAVSTLAEIEKAVDALPPSQKQELLLFLAARLRAERVNTPEPRRFSSDQIREWMAQDEAELQRFKGGK